MKHFSVIGLKRCWLLSAFFFLPVILGAAGPRKTRILFLLDASSSMTYTWNPGFTRFDVAGNILLKIMDSIYSLNNEIEFAVRAYGSGYAAQLHNCTDTKLEVPFNLQNTDQIKTRLANIHPVGSSPIAYSLKQASDHELNQVSEYDYSVIFITDGGESCNGDVCGVYQELLQKKISIKPYIIGLDSNETLRSYYQCMGDYIQVNNTDDIDRAIRLIVEANQSIIQKPRQLNLQTRYSNVSSIKDSILVV
ncbi:MAG TPA: VWA domain-containing protein, partial [Chitinophagaceae bacterium]|nr:VWA domain-containing protein [Chitinophagaceae bacterium]